MVLKFKWTHYGRPQTVCRTLSLKGLINHTIRLDFFPTRTKKGFTDLSFLYSQPRKSRRRTPPPLTKGFRLNRYTRRLHASLCVVKHQWSFHSLSPTTVAAFDHSPPPPEFMARHRGTLKKPFATQPHPSCVYSDVPMEYLNFTIGAVVAVAVGVLTLLYSAWSSRRRSATVQPPSSTLDTIPRAAADVHPAIVHRKIRPRPGFIAELLAHPV